MAEHMSQTHAAFVATDMSVVKEERYVFKVDWFDKQADLIRQYLLTFYPADASAEMVSDLQNVFRERRAVRIFWSQYANRLFPKVRPQEQENVHEKNAMRWPVRPRALPRLHRQRARQAAEACRLRGHLHSE